MKNNWIALVLAFSVVALYSCDDDSKVLDDGLTQDIHDLVPEDILETIEGLGMPINGGGNPPVIENIYLISPFLMQNSNVPNDYSIGTQFADFRGHFYDQDNDNLRIKLNYKNGGETGSGLGGFIVGDDNKFTVFVELVSYISDNRADIVMMFSGRLTSEGIEDTYVANFMIDNYGNPGETFIPIGTGRVFKDGDDLSVIIPSLKDLEAAAEGLSLSGKVNQAGN